MPGGTTSLSRREQLVAGAVIATVIALAVVTSARVVATDLRQGPWWAIAGALRGVEPLAGVASVLIAVLGVVTLLEHRPQREPWARGFLVAAVTMVAILPALLTLGRFGQTRLFLLPAGLTLLPLVIGLLWRRARTWLLAVATVPAAVTIALAAEFVDNSEDPIPIGISLAVIWSPFVIGLSRRFVAPVLDRAIRTVIVALHTVGLVFVVGAATSCHDDDCIPVPMWFLTGTLALVWTTVALLIAPPSRTALSAREDAPAPQIEPTGVFGGWTWLAPLIVLVFAAGLAWSIDPDREPPRFDAAPPETVAALPTPLAWDDRRGCVVVAGIGGTNLREACDASFVAWVEPSPLLVIEERADSFWEFDPVTFDRTPRSWESVTTAVESSAGLRLVSLDRGRVEAWIDLPNGESRLLLDGQGGRFYGLDDGAVSPDGTLAAVLDDTGRLLLVPTDGSSPAEIIATDVRRLGGWMPEFGPPVSSFALEPTRPLRVPQGVEESRDFHAAHRALDEEIGLSVVADLVALGDEVHVRLNNVPSAEQLPDGYCLAVTSFFESAPAVRTYRSVDIGGAVPFCDASTEQLPADCAAPTAPTAATLDDLERFEVLVIEAELIAPRDWTGVTSSPGYFQLSTGQLTGGALNPDDLPRVPDNCG